MHGKKHSPESLAKMRAAKQEHGKVARGPLAANWKGGRHLSRGYVVVLVRSAEELELFESMIRDGYVMEHRLVMARSLGRALKSSEVVHHLNGKKDDNRLSNLEVMGVGSHGKSHAATVAEVRRLRLEVEGLRAKLSRFESLESRAGG